jgi:hypothetical protein
VIVTSYVFRDGGLDEDRLQRLVRQRCCAHSSSPRLGACASGGG